MTRLYHGDMLEILPTVEAGSVDFLFADLPYQVTNREWDARVPLDRFWAESLRVLATRGVIALTAVQPFTSELVVSQLAHFREELVWHKSRGANFASVRRRHMRMHETILIFSKAPNYVYHPQMIPGSGYKRRTQKARSNTAYGSFAAPDVRPNEEITSRYPGSVLAIPSMRQQDLIHPTQKPVPLMEHLIRSYSDEGALVLDPCFGSASTLIAARNSGRRFQGIERDQRYYDRAVAMLSRSSVWSISQINKS